MSELSELVRNDVTALLCTVRVSFFRCRVKLQFALWNGWCTAGVLQSLDVEGVEVKKFSCLFERKDRWCCLEICRADARAEISPLGWWTGRVPTTGILRYGSG